MSVGETIAKLRMLEVAYLNALKEDIPDKEVLRKQVERVRVIKEEMLRATYAMKKAVQEVERDIRP